MRMRFPFTHPEPAEGSSYAPDGASQLAYAVVDTAELSRAQSRQRGVRRRERTLAVVVAVVALVTAAVIAAQAALTPAGSAPSPAVLAQAVGVLVVRPNAPVERIADAQPILGARPSDRAASALYAAGTDGRVATISHVTTSAALSSARKQSSATASVERISLFAGRVLITHADIEAKASTRQGRASGQVVVAPQTTVTVDGTPVAVTPNKQVVVEGVGTLLLDEQAVVASAPTGDAQTGPRYRVVGALAHVRLTQPYEGLPIGAELVIGRVDAGIREGKVVEVAHPDVNVAPTAPTAARDATSGGAGLGQTGTPKPGEATLPRHAASVRANGAAPTANLQLYTFPVLGHATYSNDYGAPRASTGIPHQGNDIFADEGTPIVAVADGTLNRVGWNAIGGYRFWLVDRYGNAFYHAHLSAYAPIAVDGGQVKSGDVIGFVGHTGDAQGTPDHLHFEVHPAGGEPTNPFPLLNAWRHGTAVAIGLTGAAGSPRIGALALLGFTDISANSGLQENVLASVPETTAKAVEFENAPVDTDDSLRGAIAGPGTTSRR
ncbi:MAG: metalloendopeptidase-like rane protein [Thermoleophilia bacterium]|nr:metalloendopeptidase-like rane protein [Thermoleophilia bacterium]